jgi:hypothetical protein
MRLAAAATGWMVVLVLAACGEPDRRLDEFEFYRGPEFSLKVVRYYRNIPFEQLGEHAVVMCRSGNTAEFTASDPRDSGWRVLGAVPGADNASAQAAASRVQDDYEVLDSHTLVARTTAFNISFDACGHFISWDPGRLPAALLVPAIQPDSCTSNDPADCRGSDFEGARAPRYDQVRVPGNGQVSFVVASKAFRGVAALQVRTGNQGAVWHVDTMGLDAGGSRLSADALRALSVAALEHDLQESALADWLESLLPPRSMVIWPDALAACDRRPGAGQDPLPGQCAGIRFNDAEGNHGVLYLAMEADAEQLPRNVTFHSGNYVSGGRSRTAGSLSGLQEYLAAGAR